MTAHAPSRPAIGFAPTPVGPRPATAGLSAMGPGLTVLRSLVMLVLVAFAILVVLPVLVAAQAAAAL